jgi:hypothetical protein
MPAVLLEIPRQFTEAEGTRNREYEATVRRLLRSADGWEKEAVNRASAVLTEFQYGIAGQLSTLVGDDWRRVQMQQVHDALEDAWLRLTPEINGQLSSVFNDALDDYTGGYVGFYKALGLSGPMTATGISTDLAVVAANLTTEQIMAIGPQTMQAITGQIRRAVLSEQNPMDAIRALASGEVGPDFQAIGPFRTLRQRAEADVRTEIHRMFNVADESQHQTLAREVPGTLFYWYQYSSRNPRETHTRVAAQTQADPIGPDDLFTVGGYECHHPHDPALPAKESVNCNCKKFPDFRAVDLEAVARQTALEAQELGVEDVKKKAEGAGAQAAPEVTSKRKTKAKKKAPKKAPAVKWDHLPNPDDWDRYLDVDAPAPDEFFDQWAAASGKGKAGGLDDALREATRQYMGKDGYKAGSLLPNHLEEALLDHVDRQAVAVGVPKGKLLDAKGNRVIPRWTPQQTVDDLNRYLEDIGGVRKGTCTLGEGFVGAGAQPVDMDALNQASRAVYETIVKQGRRPLGALTTTKSGDALADAWSGITDGRVRLHPGVQNASKLYVNLAGQRDDYHKFAAARRAGGQLYVDQLAAAEQQLADIKAELVEQGLKATTKKAPAGASQLVEGILADRKTTESKIRTLKKLVGQITSEADAADLTPWHNQGQTVYDVMVHELGHVMHYRMPGGVTWAYEDLGGITYKSFSPKAVQNAVEGRLSAAGKRAARLVSEYAQTNTKELLAEAWTAYNRGDFRHIPPDVLKVIQTLVDSLE